MYKITAHFGASRNENLTLPLNKTVTSWCTIFRVYIIVKNTLTKILYIIVQKTRSIFPIFRNFQGIPPDSPPKMDTLIAV